VRAHAEVPFRSQWWEVGDQPLVPSTVNVNETITRVAGGTKSRNRRVITQEMKTKKNEKRNEGQTTSCNAMRENFNCSSGRHLELASGLSRPLRAVVEALILSFLGSIVLVVHDDLTDTSTSTSVVSKSVSKAFSVCNTCIAVEPLQTSRHNASTCQLSSLRATAYLAKV